MRSIGDAIFFLLDSDPAIRELTNGKVYPNIETQSIEKDTGVVYNVRDTNRTGCQGYDIYYATYQLWVQSRRYDTLDMLCDKIRTRMHRFTGLAAGVQVSAINYLSENDEYVYEEEIHGRMLDFSIMTIKNNN